MCSIMHLPEGGYCNIKAIVPVHCVIKGQIITRLGQTVGLSETDKIEINRRYPCRSKFKIC